MMLFAKTNKSVKSVKGALSVLFRPGLTEPRAGRPEDPGGPKYMKVQKILRNSKICQNVVQTPESFRSSMESRPGGGGKATFVIFSIF